MQREGHPRYRNGFRLTLHPDRLSEPLRRQQPHVFFVCSMSDLFHSAVPEEYLFQVFAVMNRAQQHLFQVLTKRIRRAARLADRDSLDAEHLDRNHRRDGRLLLAHSLLTPDSSAAKIPFGGAAAGTDSGAAPRRHRMGSGRWRVGARGAPLTTGMGADNPRPMPGSGGSLLL
ncbi:MAG: hypothetical protein KatS3mg115_2269 [Candidatus Poribacteria bacterium]|nr:MAG: hypothetical protein KatS3mg115_2269 [Candidatus Poribacteria bacterium]